MATNTLNILKPSVNNLTVRIFVRAAGLDFEEQDVWGKKPEYLGKYPAQLTPMLEEEGLPRGALGESCAIMAYLCNKHGLEQFYPSDPEARDGRQRAVLLDRHSTRRIRATYRRSRSALPRRGRDVDAATRLRRRPIRIRRPLCPSPSRSTTVFPPCSRSRGNSPSMPTSASRRAEFLRAIDTTSRWAGT